jgi:membrane-bound lytic murein transglycosylase A
MRRLIKFLLPLVIVSLLGGCTRGVVKSTEKSLEFFSPVALSSLDLTDDLDVESLMQALDNSIRYYETAGRDKRYRIGGRPVSAKELKETLVLFRDLLKEKGLSQDFSAELVKQFHVFRIAGDSEKVLFTGYYEPLLEGSLEPTERYRYPVYRVPPDLSKRDGKIGREEKGRFVPYYSRREIDIDGVLRGKNLEIAWVSDLLDLFSLHIQGSGKIRLTDGRVISVGFAASNGRPFRSITQAMLDSGKISASEASYRLTFLKNREEKDILDVLSQNERYVFFRVLKGDPIGSLGEPVTAGRTIATDPDYFPEGALAFIRLRKPFLDVDGKVKGRMDFSRFVLNQDKGSAILGPGRVDLFCGFGDEAGMMAGTLKEQGELYLLLKK